MATGIVTVGRKQYASGLYWENSPSGRITQAAKEAARQPGAGADFFATRSGNKQGRVPQFGLAPTSPDFRTGMPSLAGCLANQQPGSWIGAFRLREGSALVIVRDDLIVPDGDQFYLDETEARDRLYQEMAIGGFQKVYAPEAWGVPSADTMPISLLLNDRTDVRLQNVVLSKQAKIVLLIGGSLLLLVLGFGWKLQYQKDQEENLRRQKQATIERMKDEARKMVPGIGQKPVYPPPDRKWEKNPPPLVLIQACQDAFSQVDVALAGWVINSLRCSSSGLEVKWKKTGGFSATPPKAVVSDNMDAAFAKIPLENIKPRGPEQLVDPDVVTKRYLNQNWGAAIKRELDDPLPPRPAGYKGEWNPPPAPWIKRSFTFSVPVLPWTLPMFLEDLPGVIIKSVSLSGNAVETRNTWKVEGVIYENRR